MYFKVKSLIIFGFFNHYQLFVFLFGGIMEFSNRRQSGQGLLEYALIMMLVALVVILLIMIIGPAVGNIFSNVVSNL